MLVYVHYNPTLHYWLKVQKDSLFLNDLNYKLVINNWIS